MFVMAISGQKRKWTSSEMQIASHLCSNEMSFPEAQNNLNQSSNYHHQVKIYGLDLKGMSIENKKKRNLHSNDVFVGFLYRSAMGTN